MLISPANVGDAPTIYDLQRLAFQTEAAIYRDNSIRPLTETLSDLESQFGSRKFLKATENGRVIGSIRAFAENGTCFVERLMTHPEFRRQGIGTALLARIETLFPNADRFELFTGEKSVENLRLYERLGYRRFRRKQISDSLHLIFLEKKRREGTSHD